MATTWKRGIARGAFIGRRAALERLFEALGRERLISVLGPAGMGKTRLVGQLGEELLEREPGGGVWFCDLSLCRSVEAMCVEVARALGVPLPPGAPIKVSQALIGEALEQHGEGALLCDNFEQLLAVGGAEVVAQWLERTSSTRVVVTSRERLRLDEEWTYLLEPLSLPEEGRPVDEAESVQLFLECASHHRGRPVSFDGERGETIAKIVTCLDGIPLAIELAAARTRIFGVVDIERRLRDRFELLSQSHRRGQSRQSTLWGAIDWSWQMLREEEREALCQCAVFRGGWSAEAAAEVLKIEGAQVLDLLDSLVDKSLLYAHEVGDGVRFGCYLSIAEYASVRLNERGGMEAAALRHAQWFGPRCFEWREASHGADLPETTVARWIDAERDNLQETFERAAERGASRQWARLGVRALLSLNRVRVIEGAVRSHLAHLDRARTLCKDRDLQARVLIARGGLGCIFGRLEEAQQDLEEAVALCEGEPLQQIDALTELGIALHREGNMKRAKEVYARAQALLELPGRAHDSRTEVRLVGSQALFHHHNKEPVERVEAEYRKAIEMSRQLRDAHSEGIYWMNLGRLFHETMNLPEARACILRAEEVIESVGDQRLEAMVLLNLGEVTHDEGEIDTALSLYTRALDVVRGLGDVLTEGTTLHHLGVVHHQRGELMQAAELYTRSISCLESGGGRRPLGTSLLYLSLAQSMAETPDEAAVSLERGEQVLGAHGDPSLTHLLELGGCALKLARWHAGAPLPDLEEVRTRVEAARGDLSKVVRDVVALLEHLLERDSPAHAPSFWRVDSAGEGFEGPHRPWVDLRRRRVLRPLLRALAQAHLDGGRSLSANELFEAGWAGEQVGEASRANRIYVAIATLRKLGLRPVLHQRDGGYVLDPLVCVS